MITLGLNSGNDIVINLAKEIPTLGDRFDTVIHCAGKAHISQPNKEQQVEIFMVNYQGTMNLLSGFEKSGKLPKSFIFISTVSVYGLDKGEEIKEDHPLNGTSPYTESKMKAEEFLVNWGKENRVMIGILRLPLVVGPNPPGNLGAMISAIKKGKYFRVAGNRARKSMVNGRDLVQILDLLAQKGGTYNLTDGIHSRVNELEDVIANSFGKKIKAIPKLVAGVAAKAGDIIGNRFPLDSTRLVKLTSTLTFSDEKARRELGWKPTPVLDHLAEILQ